MNRLKGLSLMRNILFALMVILMIYSILAKYFPQYAFNSKKFENTKIETTIKNSKPVHGAIITYKAGISSIRSVMDIKKRYNFGEMKIYLGNIGSCDLVVALCEDGKVNATMAATTLVTKFNVVNLTLINTGISLSKDLKPNSIVVGTNIFQFDCKDISQEGFGIRSMNGTQSMKLTVDAVERDNAFVKIQKVVSGAILGNISTGDLKITDPKHGEELKNAYNSLVADSESIAVGAVGANFEKPFISITIVTESIYDSNTESDIVERDKNVSKILGAIFSECNTHS